MRLKVAHRLNGMGENTDYKIYYVALILFFFFVVTGNRADFLRFTVSYQLG